MCIPLAAAGLIVTAVGTAASVGMGIMSANQQAAQANAQMQMQASQAQANVYAQNQAAAAQQAQVRQQMAQQRTQFEASSRLQLQQQLQGQQFQLQQQASQNRFSLRSQRDQQIFAGRQQQLQMDQAARFQEQNTQIQITQQQEALRFQQEQAAESRNLQIEQMNAQLQDAYTQQRAAVKAEREQLMAKNEVDRQIYQDSVETADLQKMQNAEAANRVYVAEQADLDSKRKEAAFEAQSIVAKSIGAKGQILASGRTGQSVGLLVNDVERQAGIQKAQQTAMLEADRVSAIIGMENAYNQNKASDLQAESNIGFDPTMPYLPQMPEVPTFVGFQIPK